MPHPRWSRPPIFPLCAVRDTFQSHPGIVGRGDFHPPRCVKQRRVCVEQVSIEWTEETWNPTTGCDPHVAGLRPLLCPYSRPSSEGHGPRSKLELLRQYLDAFTTATRKRSKYRVYLDQRSEAA